MQYWERVIKRDKSQQNKMANITTENDQPNMGHGVPTIQQNQRLQPSNVQYDRMVSNSSANEQSIIQNHNRQLDLDNGLNNGQQFDIRPQLNNTQQSNNCLQLNIDTQPNNQQLKIKKYNIRNLISDQHPCYRELIHNFVNQMRNDDSEQELKQEEQSKQEQSEVLQQIQPRKQNTSKYNVSKSFKYLLKLFCQQSPYLIPSLIIILAIVILQLNYEVDSKNCNLKELFEKGKERNFDNKCPLDSYLIIKARNIIALYYSYTLFILIMINIYQFQNKKLVQIMFTVLMIIYIAIEYIGYSLDRTKLINEYVVISLIFILFYKFISKHNWGTFLQRFVQVVFYIGMMSIISKLNYQIRDSRDFFASILFQYTTLVIKKVSQVYLKYRLTHNLQYDDVEVYYVGTVTLEYIFIFNYVLVQNNSYPQQTVAILNFVMIQIQNINNVSIFHLLSEYLRKLIRKFQCTIISLQYIFLVAITILNFFNMILENSFVSVSLFLIFSSVHVFLKKDNNIAQVRQMAAARKNGYFEQKIELHEIEQLTSQQSLIAYFHFSIYQILFVFIKTVFPENNSISNQYQFVYQFNKQLDNNLTLLNVIAFNLVLCLFIFILIVKKSQQPLEIVKSTTRYQIPVLQLITSIGLISMINKGLFETTYMRQQTML